MPRGGARQRQRWRAPQDVGGSSLAEFLVRQWAWGLMSPQLVQTIALKARNDLEQARLQDRSFRDLDRLASLGSEGRHPNNCHKQLVATLGPSQMPPPLRLQLPVKTPVPGVFNRLPFDIAGPLAQTEIPLEVWS